VPTSERSSISNTRFPASRSLRVRLPLLISALISVSLLLFLFLSRAQIEAALVHAGQARAQTVADQLAGVLAQGQQQRLSEVRRAAGDPAVLEYLHRRDPDSAEKATVRLATLTTASQPPVELWDTAGHLLITAQGAGKRPPTMPVVPAGVRPAAAGTGPFTQTGDAVYWTTTVESTEQNDDVPASTLGFVVSSRLLAGNGAQSETIAKLMGPGSLLRIGQPGGVWTDLARVVAAPAVARAGAISDSIDAGGHHYSGAAAQVRGTPWLVAVEYPKDEIVSPAWAFMRRMLVVAAVLVLLAGVATHFVSARITAPLGIVTAVAEKIARGEVHERVPGARRDEIGRLAIAFNTMADQVRTHREHLESRVAQRTKDVTALNQQLEQRVAELGALTSELEAFSYSVSHDLRAPVRHVTGFAALLEGSAGASLDPQSRRYLRTITESASRMGRLIDDLLLFSRMGRADMLQTRVDLNALVDKARIEIESQNAGRAIEWSIRNLPAVEGDPQMLYLVILNLLSNAVKYTSTRPIARIDVRAAREGGHAVLSVRDNGVGFDMQFAGKLFGVFQRLHSSDEFEGTGIGLANVRRIVTRHRGRAWAEGELEKGATFYVSLPLLSIPSEPAAYERPAAAELQTPS
jgi:signal transduction histidine kinase